MLSIWLLLLSSCVILVTAGSNETEFSNAWITIQKRINGDVSFDKTWIEYRNGFGDVNNFWIGNEKLYRMTQLGEMKIRFELWDKYDRYRYAEYKSFTVSSEADRYRLRISGYSGSAGDSMSYHNNMRFSTKDRDNDLYGSSCSKLYGSGGWWYRACYRSNLNGWYMPPGFQSPAGIIWSGWGYSYSLKTTLVKVAFRF